MDKPLSLIKGTDGDSEAPLQPSDKPSREEAEDAVRTLIRWAGDDPVREGEKWGDLSSGGGRMPFLRRGDRHSVDTGGNQASGGPWVCRTHLPEYSFPSARAHPWLVTCGEPRSDRGHPLPEPKHGPARQR